MYKALERTEWGLKPLLYKNRFKVFYRVFPSNSRTWYVQQNWTNRKKWSNVLGLYWELRRKPKSWWKYIPKDAWTGNVGIKRNGFWDFMSKKKFFQTMKYKKRISRYLEV